MDIPILLEEQGALLVSGKDFWDGVHFSTSRRRLVTWVRFSMNWEMNSGVLSLSLIHI